MVPVSPVNQVLPINGQPYSVQPVMVTPGFPMPYPGNMHYHSKKRKKKKKKKEKSDSESESDTESEYFYMRVSGQQHHSSKLNYCF